MAGFYTLNTCQVCQQEQPQDYFRSGRSTCRSCERERRRSWYAALDVKPHKRPEVKAYFSEWYAANSASVKDSAKTLAKANPNKRTEIVKNNLRTQRSRLSDAYVRRTISESTGVKAEQIPKPLVDAQRELLKIKRELKNNGNLHTANGNI